VSDVHGYDPAPAAPTVLAPEIDSDDIRSLMASGPGPAALPVEDRPRTPNVYAALEQLDAEREAERGAETLTHADRDAAWSALAPQPAPPEDWTAQAEPVGPEVLRWRREDDDLIPTGPNGAGRRRLHLRRR
jgi:hypothetical protein